jgi:uncharacterized protein GlcG (DUF336 family)
MALTLAHAQSLVQKAVEAGTAQNCPIVAVAVDTGGNIVAAARMDGVSFINTDVARKKALCAAAFGMATHDLAEAVSRDPLAKTVVMNDQTINVLPGGMPLRDGDAVVGGLGIAGGYYMQDRAIAEFVAAPAGDA